ncbi:hypothetical protein PN441_01050 [Spirulina major CS-329]|uniref:hypothetical protein n=1 Tax=Spirulina major TaxID=270636 RepID=UPI00232CC52E|nr:hypothetical protein [Spirulina major]MDB9501641.1 hypothetical protein [Spirulina major CS-329]
MPEWKFDYSSYNALTNYRFDFYPSGQAQFINQNNPYDIIQADYVWAKRLNVDYDSSFNLWGYLGLSTQTTESQRGVDSLEFLKVTSESTSITRYLIFPEILSGQNPFREWDEFSISLDISDPTATDELFEGLASENYELYSNVDQNHDVEDLLPLRVKCIESCSTPTPTPTPTPTSIIPTPTPTPTPEPVPDPSQILGLVLIGCLVMFRLIKRS